LFNYGKEKKTVLWFRDPELFRPLDPVSGLEQKSGSGMNIPDHFSKRLETLLWLKILKFIDADLGSFLPWIRDRKFRIRYKHPGSATLEKRGKKSTL
jgi:hypothetical protein